MIPLKFVELGPCAMFFLRFRVRRLRHCNGATEIEVSFCMIYVFVCVYVCMYVPYGQNIIARKFQKV